MIYEISIECPKKRQAKELILLLAEIGYEVYYAYGEKKVVCFGIPEDELSGSIKKKLRGLV
jgi:hypothetical protein